MEGFTYIDIYATKGIEYLIVIGFLISVMMFWRYLWVPRREVTREPARPEAERWFELPGGYSYHQGHSWMKPEGEGLVKVGLDDFAQKLLGRPDYFWLPDPGSLIHQGDVGWSLNVDSRSIDMVSPVDGEVVEVNREALDFPEIVNHDPYGKGWLLKIRPSTLGSDRRNLLSGSLARSWAEINVGRLREMVGDNLGPVYHDGGSPVSGIAHALGGERWYEVVEEFFLTGEEVP